MKNIKLYEEFVEYNDLLQQIEMEHSDKIRNLRSRIYDDIKKMMKDWGLEKVYFLYDYQYGEEYYFYDKKVDFKTVFFHNDRIDSISIDKDDIIVKSGYLNSHFFDGNTQEIIDIYNYLSGLTPDLIEQQRIKQESEKFNF